MHATFLAHLILLELIPVIAYDKEHKAFILSELKVQTILFFLYIRKYNVNCLECVSHTVIQRFGSCLYFLPRQSIVITLRYVFMLFYFGN